MANDRGADLDAPLIVQSSCGSNTNYSIRCRQNNGDDLLGSHDFESALAFCPAAVALLAGSAIEMRNAFHFPGFVDVMNDERLIIKKDQGQGDHKQTRVSQHEVQRIGRHRKYGIRCGHHRVILQRSQNYISTQFDPASS